MMITSQNDSATVVRVLTDIVAPGADVVPRSFVHVDIAVGARLCSMEEKGPCTESVNRFPRIPPAFQNHCLRGVMPHLLLRQLLG